AAQKVFSAVLRTGQSFGMAHLIDILRGVSTARVRARGDDRLPTFGCGKDLSKGQWQVVFRQLMGLDFLRPDVLKHGGLRLTEKARPVLRGEAPLILRRDRFAAAARGVTTVPRALVAEEDAPLFAALKARRRALAEAAKVPAYVVFPDRTLMEIATTRPATLDQMRGISGVGAKKLERYGRIFLEVVNGEAGAVHPVRRRIAGRASADLFDRLEDEMVRLARGESGLEVYLACTKTTLSRIAEQRPDTLEALEQLKGMGPIKAERFGRAFLDVLRSHL
ncbi:MAG: HRDC domain-containing protein, partial [Pseudomonadota bacterium]